MLSDDSATLGDLLQAGLAKLYFQKKGLDVVLRDWILSRESFLFSDSLAF